MESLSFSEIFAPVQLLAWAAAAIYLISYQRQSSEKTIILWAPADLFMFMHFYFMGAPLFMVTALGGFFRSLMAIYAPKKVLAVFLVLYTILVIALAPVLGDGIKDVFAVIGTTCFCLSVWFKHNFLIHRAFAFGHQICWIVAFVLLGSYGGLVLITIMFISNIIGTGRFIFKKQE